MKDNSVLEAIKKVLVIILVFASAFMLGAGAILMTFFKWLLF